MPLAPTHDKRERILPKHRISSNSAKEFQSRLQITSPVQFSFSDARWNSRADNEKSPRKMLQPPSRTHDSLDLATNEERLQPIRALVSSMQHHISDVEANRVCARSPPANHLQSPRPPLLPSLSQCSPTSVTTALLKTLDPKLYNLEESCAVAVVEARGRSVGGASKRHRSGVKRKNKNRNYNEDT
jgi:hypothetical protein